MEAGESGKTARRPELQRLPAYIAANRVTYCIVHKIDRLARNREDDVSIHLALRKAGVLLVSVTENIDETPSGMLAHDIMATIAEFYSGLHQHPAARDPQGNEIRTVASPSTSSEHRWWRGRSRPTPAEPWH